MIPGGVRIPRSSVGTQCFLQFGMEFKAWADKQANLTPAAIAERWGVSRATSYRYLDAYKAVTERAAA